MLVTKSAVLACLAASVTAVDIRFYRGRGCGSSYGQCGNIVEGRCCTVIPTDPNSAMSFNVLPSNANLYLWGHFQENCGGAVAGEARSNGNPNVCFPTPQYRSGRWTRGVGNRYVAEVEQSADQACSHPDKLIYEDSSEVDLADLTTEEFNEVSSVNRTIANFCFLKSSWRTFMDGGNATEVQSQIATLRI
ncbi:uncharacterized protein B0I36DRAFT_353063 [Microdochium trichocladiopsis]|uniref:Uncharacterized protein n=1 Tax=Microdochium trichocladiopsis TaxID=1682393 RepID=A0A9P8XYF7_9PEZI|nr:uncharacterized protein B0I36DRAFT_353063 [Microdochium trichocladiopsis]KAH7024874.1 hypothetical protein B0I36DRAFT_353063 [Microdochium trichocladiopsis]